VAHRTRNSPLKAATDAVETAEGHGVVLLLTFGQLLRKRDRCFHLPAGCPKALPRWVSAPYCALPCATQHVRRLLRLTKPHRRREGKASARLAKPRAVRAAASACTWPHCVRPRCMLRSLTRRVCARLRSHQLALRPNSGHAVHATLSPCVQQQALTAQ
jgi:hypothetical protein